jgi:hypothetical protein
MWVDYGVGVAIALQLKLAIIDAARDISGEHKQQVHLLIVG